MPIGTRPQEQREVRADPRQETTAVATPPRRAPRLRACNAPGVLIRAVRNGLGHHMTNLAQAIAFNLFLAIPAAALVAVGIFATTAAPGTAGRLLDHLKGIAPPSVIALLDSSLTRVTHEHGGGIAMIAVGAVLALWSLTGAVKTLMWALNIAYDRPDRRGFVRTRVAALAMLVFCGIALALVFCVLVLGPQMTDSVGSAVGAKTAVRWIWWTAQWPVLVLALLVAFAGIYRFGPDLDESGWRLVTPGAVAAIILWLAGSGAFAWYVSNLGSYNKAWGSLATVIVMLTWLWLSSLALVLGAEINAEADRTRRRAA